MNKKVLIFAEITNQKINQVFYELLSKAKDLFGEDASYACFILGYCIGVELDEVKQSGIDIVYSIDDSRLRVYNPQFFCSAFEKAINIYEPDVVFIGATSIGEEIAPTIGQRFRTGVAAHCVDLKVKERGILAQMVPAFGGKVIGEIFTQNTKPQIASVKPGIFTAIRQKNTDCKVVAITTEDCLDNIDIKINSISINQASSSKLPIEEAEIILCGGQGIGTQENWNKLEELAALLGGSCACTRPVIDSEWTSDENIMIGTSGKSVKPKVYMGFGISGATHHICGMKDSGVIINVNNDSAAEIFTVSDYAITSDCVAVIDKMIELIKGHC